MFGWPSDATARASRSKRAVSASGASSFTATRRSSSVSVARPDLGHAAAAEQFVQAVTPGNEVVGHGDNVMYGSWPLYSPCRRRRSACWHTCAVCLPSTCPFGTLRVALPQSPCPRGRRPAAVRELRDGRVRRARGRPAGSLARCRGDRRGPAGAASARRRRGDGDLDRRCRPRGRRRRHPPRVCCQE